MPFTPLYYLVIVLPQVLSTTRLVLITSCIDQNLSTIRFSVANYLRLLTHCSLNNIEKNELNSLSPQKSEKFVENVGRKKRFAVEIDERYVDQKKHQMVTYIIRKAYDKKCLRRNIKKNCRTLIAQKKIVFSRR